MSQPPSCWHTHEKQKTHLETLLWLQPNSNNTFRNVGWSLLCSLQHPPFSIPQKVLVRFYLQSEFSFRQIWGQPQQSHTRNFIPVISDLFFSFVLCTAENMINLPAGSQRQSCNSSYSYCGGQSRCNSPAGSTHRLPLQLLKHSRILAAEKVIRSAHWLILSMSVILVYSKSKPKIQCLWKYFFRPMKKDFYYRYLWWESLTISQFHWKLILD